MKVTISVGGRFWAFHLADELARHGYLERLITSYPKFVPVKMGVPREKIRSILIKELLERGWRKMPMFLQNRFDPKAPITELYDALALRKLVPCDVLDGFSSFSLRTMREAKRRYGAVTVIDHGSAHIQAQESLMEEEFARWSMPRIPFELANKRIVEKELKEYAEADAIAVPSLFSKRTFLEHGIPESKLIHVPYGVNADLFRPAPKEDNVFRVVFRANVTLRKGILYLLRAFAELKLRNAELLVIGDIAPYMHRLLKPYAGTFIHVGHQSMEDLAKSYVRGSVFVLPTVEDGFAMVLVQAMAAGLPVIATVNSGGPDLIEEGKQGFLVPIRDVDALKEKLLYLYEHPEERAEMGRAAAARVAQGFTWHDYGDGVIAAYERLLAARH